MLKRKRAQCFSLGERRRTLRLTIREQRTDILCEEDGVKEERFPVVHVKKASVSQRLLIVLRSC